ncbi:hypothetical protein HNP73_002897 [Amaricoccus macauensis]|uniref:Type II toxin-antitoxin system PemK/MazF family toxin n=1 Tax=Amaricoccus macauensis TaxID=57001 RepID=A0A840SQC5_9RHOB|nr:type II toxin-antitoxin system PemK/MazF family toxin [Amaricoccus macauensis]MBB5222950.1 hypothetical protein [Amaricoccus macauensis]
MTPADAAGHAGFWSLVPARHDRSGANTDGRTSQYRPAIVVAEIGPRAGERTPLLRVVMITSAANRGWRGDLAVPDDDATGLPIPPVVRSARIATIERSRAEPRGTVPPQVHAPVATYLPWFRPRYAPEEVTLARRGLVDRRAG